MCDAFTKKKRDASFKSYFTSTSPLSAYIRTSLLHCCLYNEHTRRNRDIFFLWQFQHLEAMYT